jgi:hypothetical protein
MQKDEVKKLRKFDGSYATIKSLKPEVKIKKLESRLSVPDFLADSKAKCAVFNSNAFRFEIEIEKSPGPFLYEPREPKYIT